MSDLTLVLHAIRDGDRQAAEALLPLVYEELRKLAAARMARESHSHTLQPTALVHEAWLRIGGEEKRVWQNRAHFFAAAAEAMRRILIERARARLSQKRGGGQLVRVELDGLNLAAALPDDKILLLHEALEQLEKEDPDEARVVVLKFFGGLTIQETADVLGVSSRTVIRQWTAAKVWLYQQIKAKL